MTNRLLANPYFSPGLIICRANRPVPDGSVLKAATDDLERLFIINRTLSGAQHPAMSSRGLGIELHRPGPGPMYLMTVFVISAMILIRVL